MAERGVSSVYSGLLAEETLELAGEFQRVVDLDLRLI